MDENNLLALRFEAERGRLKTMAVRMLGSAAEAEDVIQDAWLKLTSDDAAEVGNLGGWLTTVVSRACLDILRGRKVRKEAAVEDAEAIPSDVATAEEDAALADSVGVALLVVLEALTPPERVAFVLHDMFDLSFDEIAPVIGRSADAARQLASRARRRVRGEPAEPEVDPNRHRTLIEAFLSASRAGDMSALLAVLSPDVVLRADPATLRMSAGRAALAPSSQGADAVADFFRGRAQTARFALIDGLPGLVFAPGGQVRVVFEFTIVGDRIAAIDLIADPDGHREREVQVIGS